MPGSFGKMQMKRKGFLFGLFLFLWEITLIWKQETVQGPLIYSFNKSSLY